MRIWLCGMSGPGSANNLRELIDPIKSYFTGVVWTLHDARESPETTYLESVKGAGKVIHYYYHRRHEQSRNQYLWCGPIEQGDWVVSADDLERINPEFAQKLPDLIGELERYEINAAFLFGKHFMFQYHESLRYQGSPHESPVRDDGGLRPIDLQSHFPDEKQVRYGVRHLKRLDHYHFVGHYAKYFLFPWGSNHALLGLENRGDIRTLFPKREALRLEFLAEMRARGFPRTLEGLKAMLSGPLDDRLKWFLNNEKVWQDYYRYEVLGDKTVRDEHLWTSMIEIA